MKEILFCNVWILFIKQFFFIRIETRVGQRALKKAEQVLYDLLKKKSPRNLFSVYCETSVIAFFKYHFDPNWNWIVFAVNANEKNDLKVKYRNLSSIYCKYTIRLLTVKSYFYYWLKYWGLWYEDVEI